MDRSWRVKQGPPVELNEQERKLADNLKSVLHSLREGVLNNRRVSKEEIDNLADVAKQLHMLLAARGHEPKHHKYMLQNRSVAPTHPDFYKHVHAVEDLLRFIDNENANDDPVDVTLGETFDFNVYSRRWGHDDHYRVKRTPSGWTFTHMQEIETGRDARVGSKPDTGLFQLLDHDSINYPEELPGYFEWLWEQAGEKGLPREEVQEAIGQLAAWVNTCERASPRGIFEGYK